MLDRQRVDQSLLIPRTLAVEKLAIKFRRKSKDARKYRRAVVVHGMGGTGKTQLVLQYIEKYQHEYSTVLWIDATSPESYVLSCRRICIRLHLFDAKHHDPAHQALVPQRSMAVDHLLDWLMDRPPVDNWLVVIDNLDEMSWGMTDVMPRGASGNLIVTSRDADIAALLGFSKYRLESMEKEEAANFLRVAAFRELEDTSEELEAHCAEFCVLVDYLPLAIHLAAATIGYDPEVLELDDNITAQDACLAVARHMDRFNINKDLLLMGDAHKYMQSPYPRTLLTTFETTFVRLKENCGPHTPPAMDLLRLLAFLDDGVVAQLHERLRLAYGGALTNHREYASMNLSKWLSKLLTGESSVAMFPIIHREHSQWDNQGFRDTIRLLQRYGLVRPREFGSPEIVPLHKIVRWRVQKEGENQIREVLSEYVIILQLALSSSLQDPEQMMRLSDELADLYHILERSQDAIECATIHLERSIKSYGRPHPNTMRSLARLIEILCSKQLQGQVAREVFAFVRDSDNRDAVLAALPSDLLLIFQSVFSQPENPDATQQNPRRALLDCQPGSENKSVVPFPAGLLSQGYSQQQAALWPGKQTALFRPGHDTGEIHDRISHEVLGRTRVLQAKAHNKPDLVTLFEVLSLGSSELVSMYMRYIDSETVRFRDPICGRTVLHFVAAHGEPKDVLRCIEQGSDMNAIDRYGVTPLQIADFHGRREVFRGLIQDTARDLTRDTPRMMRDAVMPPSLTIDGRVNQRSLGSTRQEQRSRETNHQLEPARTRSNSESRNVTFENYSHQPYVEEYDSDSSWDPTCLEASASPAIRPTGGASHSGYDWQKNTRNRSVDATRRSTSSSKSGSSEHEQWTENPDSGSEQSALCNYEKKESLTDNPFSPEWVPRPLRSPLLSVPIESPSAVPRQLSARSGNIPGLVVTREESINTFPDKTESTLLASVPGRTGSPDHESSRIFKDATTLIPKGYNEAHIKERVARELLERRELPCSQPAPADCYSASSPVSPQLRSAELSQKSFSKQEVPVGQDVPGSCDVLKFDEKHEGEQEKEQETLPDGSDPIEPVSSLGFASSHTGLEARASPNLPGKDHSLQTKKKKRRRRRHHTSPRDSRRSVHENPSPDHRPPETQRSARASQRSAPLDNPTATTKASRAPRNREDRKTGYGFPAETSKSPRGRPEGGRSLLSTFWKALTGRRSPGIDASSKTRR